MFPKHALVHDTVFPELQQEGPLSLRQDVLGRDYKGRASRKIVQKTSALIKKLQSPLSKFLEPGEQILYIARAQRYTPVLIQYTLLWYIYYYSGAVVVFTDRRLFCLRVTSNNRWDEGVRSCAWSEIESAKVKGGLNRTLKLKFKNGTKYQYWRIARADALNIEKLLLALLKAHEGHPYQSKGLVSLCPECKYELIPAARQCSGCGLGFKIKKTMYWLSLIPSAAYIYTHKRFLAAIDFLAQSYGYLMLVAGIYIFIAAILGWKGAGGKPIVMSAALPVLANGIIIFFLDVIITIHHNGYFIEDLIPAGPRAQSVESIPMLTAAKSIG